MYTKDKILDCGEIKSQGSFGLTNHPFYLMLVPQQDGGESVAIITGRLALSDSEKEIPFIIGTWNPVSVRDIKVTSEMLQKYRIFYGVE